MEILEIMTLKTKRKSKNDNKLSNGWKQQKNGVEELEQTEVETETDVDEIETLITLTVHRFYLAYVYCVQQNIPILIKLIYPCELSTFL